MLNTNAYNKLLSCFSDLSSKKIKDLFADKSRMDFFVRDFNGLHLDLSKNLITKDVIDVFVDLAKEMGLQKGIKDMISGEKINFTEQRAVLHTILRRKNIDSIIIDGKDFKDEILLEREKFTNFVNQFTNGEIKGYSGEKITDIVNIGIGGSYLGTQMVYNALKDRSKNGVKMHFISNIDASNLVDVLENINPQTTLFVVASKTFTTQETMTNANTIKQWFISHANSEAVSKHFIALSTNIQQVESFGINKNWAFGFWDFIGGRYSVWSSIGLPLALALGMESFGEFLYGASLVDSNLQGDDLYNNIPFLLAVIGIWYNNFFNYHSYAILPYDYRLRDFTRYIQQLEMESNGKYINKNSQEVTYATSPVVFGEPGSDSQHSFFQLLHQGTQIIPCDFIGFMHSNHKYDNHQDILIANLFAQSEALMVGKNKDEVVQELKAQNLNDDFIKQLTPHRVFQGNRPTNTFLFDELSPKNLGMLCALYEHKIFIQGFLWEINSFDQWGVELGKKLANNILNDINSTNISGLNSLSTQGLIDFYKKNK